MPKLSLSVQEFAQPIKRSGSLRKEIGLGGLESLGVIAHQRIQSRQEQRSHYKKEVTYKIEIRKGQYNFKISGRADGVFYDSIPLIQEIKSTLSYHSLIEKMSHLEDHPFLLQLKMYLFMHLRSCTDDQVRGQMLIVSLKNGREKPLEINYDDEVFSSYVDSRVKQLINEHKAQLRREVRRKNLSKALTFPFRNQRRFQEDLILSIQEIVENGGQALVQAPTGIGKTLGLLYPTLRESLSRGCPTIYTAPKNSQFHLVESSSLQLSKAMRRKIRTLTLTAKSKICLNDQVICDGEHCLYAKNYYDKIENTSILARLKRCHKIDRQVLRSLGEEYQVCPYYLSLEVLKEADVVIGDYNYCFSPRAKVPASLCSKVMKKNPNLLIDEAHNLYERALDYYSPSIVLSAFTPKEQLTVPNSLRQDWLKVLEDLSELFRFHKPRVLPSLINLDQEYVNKIQVQFADFMFSYLSEQNTLPENDPFLFLFFAYSSFAEIVQNMEMTSKVIYQIGSCGDEIRVVCCDASSHLKPILTHFRSVFAFSATLKPFDFYRRLSGFLDTAQQLEFDTPFSDKNRKLLVVPQISTSFRHRKTQYEKIASVILRLSAEKRGHYMAFFPSYSFMEKMVHVLKDRGMDLHIQQPRMSGVDQKKLLSNMDCSKSHSVLMAVQGGSFSEGLDVHSEFLNGVFVVGPAVPLKTYERDLRMDYYQQSFGKGFEYSYIYPAMARSVQAAGRVIRSQNKRGLIVLMDQRFQHPSFAEAMPRYWFKKSILEKVETGLISKVRDFWQS